MSAEQPAITTALAEPATEAMESPAADVPMEEVAEAEAEAEAETVTEAVAVAVAEEDDNDDEQVAEIVAVTVVDDDDDESADADVPAEAVIAEELDDDDDDNADDASEATGSRKRRASDADDSLASSVAASGVGDGGPCSKKAKSSKKKSAAAIHVESGAHKGERVPKLRQLTVPFRNTRRTMKLNVDPVTIVQNEAAIVATYAMELFLLKFSRDSLNNAKKKGRHTIRYEDLAEARMMDPNLNFLDYLIP